ncbi:MAG: hypothetical protein ACTSYF_08720 [Promethearchaeota archaeon]
MAIERTNTLIKSVASEMAKKLIDIDEIINMLKKDTWIEEIRDSDGNVIGQRTHLHPQLLSWYKEGRSTLETIFKLSGGEVSQEAEKQKIKLKAKLIMELVGKPEKERKELIEKWKASTSFKR